MFLERSGILYTILVNCSLNKLTVTYDNNGTMMIRGDQMFVYIQTLEMYTILIAVFHFLKDAIYSSYFLTSKIKNLIYRLRKTYTNLYISERRTHGQY